MHTPSRALRGHLLLMDLGLLAMAPSFAAALSALALGLLGGCSVLPGAKLWLPDAFGLLRIDARLYVEPGMDASAQAALQQAAQLAEQRMQQVFGPLQSRPVLHACWSAACLKAFGGEGTFAKAYGERILLSARGANWQFIAHEWSHAELLSRLSLRAWLRLPQWFDEGLAVAVSEAPEHAEAHWRSLEAAGLARPTAAELRGLRSGSAWRAAGRRYSDGQNALRRARGEPEQHALYAGAGHLLRPWLAQAGRQGLRQLIDGLNAGLSFESACPPIEFADGLPC